MGGWSDSQYFSDAVATAARRESFAASCVDFVVEQGLDGVDLDWEYPGIRRRGVDIHRRRTKQNFTLLLQELREQLDRAGPPGREGLRPHYRRRRRELVLKPDRGREGGRHCGPHLRDGL